jgi:hypothetical protein
MRRRPLGNQVVEQAIEGLARWVGLRAVGLEEEGVPAGAQVPFEAPRGSGEVPPAAGNAEFSEVDEAGDGVVIDEDVGEAVIAVADDEVFIGRAKAFEFGKRRLDRSKTLVFGVKVALRDDEPGGCAGLDMKQRGLELEVEGAGFDRSFGWERRQVSVAAW